MNDNFLNISQLDCQKTYMTILENSDRHFMVAEKISKIDSYGIAISHLILSTEELVKALIIYLDGEGLHLRSIKGIKKFFYHHEIRHFFSNMFVVMSLILRSVMYFAKRINTLTHNPELISSATELETAIINGNESQLDKIVKSLTENKIKHKAELIGIYSDFWDIADQTKQRGLYVDYDKKLYSPNDFSEKDYIFAKEVINSFRRECKKFLNKVKNTPKDERVEIIKFINKDKTLYDTFESMIQNK